MKWTHKSLIEGGDRTERMNSLGVFIDTLADSPFSITDVHTEGFPSSLQVAVTMELAAPSDMAAVIDWFKKAAAAINEDQPAQ